MSENWLRCIECNQIARITENDGVPYYHCDEKLEEVIEELMDDREHFVVQHLDHKLEELRIIKNSFISEGRYEEPLKVSYYEATNGRGEQFVIKGWREDIKTPLRYELILGCIKILFRLEVQSEEIRRQMKKEITIPSVTEIKIEQFVQIVEMVVSQFSRRDEIEITAETNTPLISYCKLDTNYIREILRLSEEIFDAAEVKKIKQFIYQNNNYNEPMTLLLKRDFTIKRKHTTPHKSKKEEALFGEVVKQRSNR